MVMKVGQGRIPDQIDSFSKAAIGRFSFNKTFGNSTRPIERYIPVIKTRPKPLREMVRSI